MGCGPAVLETAFRYFLRHLCGIGSGRQSLPGKAGEKTDSGYQLCAHHRHPRYNRPGCLPHGARHPFSECHGFPFADPPAQRHLSGWVLDPFSGERCFSAFSGIAIRQRHDQGRTVIFDLKEKEQP